MSSPIRHQFWFRIVLLCVVSAQACLLVNAALVLSPTFNEVSHLVAGLYSQSSGGFELYRVNPPLVRSVATIPLLFCSIDTSSFELYRDGIGSRSVFAIGEDFVSDNGRATLWYVQAARIVAIAFTVLGGIVAYLWSKQLFSTVAASIAIVLWASSPSVLANGCLLTPDAHATSLGLAACYTFWCWLRRPSIQQSVLTGVTLGFAELAKTTMILFYPLWPVLWIAYRWPERHSMTFRRWRDEAGMLVLRMLIGIYVVNLGYLGEGSFTPLKDFRFVSDMLTGTDKNVGVGGNRFDGSWLGEMLVPLPADYIIGIDLQQRDFESYGRPSYLRGEYHAKGWWYYYAYAILVKTPLGTLGAIALTLSSSWFKFGPQAERRDLLILLAPAVVIFVVASAKHGFSHHSRYILPCVPFVFIWISGLAHHIVSSWETASAIWGRRKVLASISHSRWLSSATGIISVCLLCWTTASSLAVYPHSISYFNELAGGPKNGPAHLLNSNIDWGQDLLFLEKWIQDEGPSSETPIHLAFYNYYNPFDLEIEGIEPWPFRRDGSHIPSIEERLKPELQQVPDGLYAVSVNLLYEFPWPARDRDGRRYLIDNRPLAYLRTQEPVGWAGYSIRVFSAQQVRDAYAAPPQPPLWSQWQAPS